MDTRIDNLYQLPLEEFTKARNALAKTLSGDAKRVVASLAKPTLPMWAVNQLYWKDRATYKALIDASEKLRDAHRALLSGKKTDLRKPDAVHRAALDRAVARAIKLLEQADGRISETARDTIRRALAALPTDEQAGRLTREPPPAGFSLFAGVTPRATTATATAAEPKAESKRAPVTPPKKQDDAAKRRREQREQQQADLAREKAERARAEALAALRKEMKGAQQAAERSTFAVRKAEVDLEKARTEEERAANRLKDAERRLSDLERS